ncbi:YicC/YloC family endoribonuclease [Limnohabitans sp.]|uniref:YicC/YloC family endoribonuclease n=1 Tax=Limnohabitans sp. TaxID=1907725 RepID=UPI0037C00BB6
MPVYSMTGYASVQHSPQATDGEGPASTSPTARLGLEIRSVNSRFLDLSFRLPEELRQLEPGLRELITRHIKRGKVEVRASQDAGDGATLQAPGHQTLQKIAALQDKIHDWLPNAPALSVSDVLRMTAGSSGQAAPDEAAWLKLATQVVKALSDARAREGARLTEMLQGHITQLLSLGEQAVPLVPQLVEQQRQRFLERWKDAMALADGSHLPEAAQDRALTEATAFAIRIDVAEELTRLRSHLEEISRLLKKGGDIGKRLDFLIQELHREANTLGSKSAALEMTRISVDMKVLIEQMREQVQNIE